MNKKYPVAFISLALAAGSAFAAKDVDSPKGAQQAKFSACSKDAKAKALKGADRRQFMSTCLKAKA